MTVENALKKQLANKYGLTLAEVDEIIQSQSEFTAKVMSKLSDRETLHFPAIRLPGFGVFHCPDYVIKNLIKLQEKQKQTDYDTNGLES